MQHEANNNIPFHQKVFKDTTIMGTSSTKIFISFKENMIFFRVHKDSLLKSQSFHEIIGNWSLVIGSFQVILRSR